MFMSETAKTRGGDGAFGAGAPKRRAAHARAGGRGGKQAPRHAVR